MTATPTHVHDLSGTWNAEITFGEGPREGEVEPVELTLHADGVIIHSDEPVLQAGGQHVQPPRGIGEWAVEDDRLAYWFYEVRTDPAGKPTIVVRVQAEGTVGAEAQTFTAAGTGEVYGTGGELLVTNHTTVRATRAGAA